MRLLFVLSVLLSADIIPADAGAQSASSMPSALDPSRLVAGTDSFVVMMQGKPLGWQRSERIRRSDGWEVRDAIALIGVGEQESRVHFDTSLQERTLRQSGMMRGKPMAIALDFTAASNGVRVKGTADTPSNPAGIVHLDTILPAGTIDDNAVMPLLFAVPWRDGMTLAIPVVASGKGTLEIKRLKVLGAESVTVPAGTFAVWRVQQDVPGGQVQYDITRAAPYRLVRMQQVGTPFEIVLVHSREAGPSQR